MQRIPDGFTSEELLGNLVDDAVYGEGLVVLIWFLHPSPSSFEHAGASCDGEGG
jgi:hypothetical protein